MNLKKKFSSSINIFGMKTIYTLYTLYTLYSTLYTNYTNYTITNYTLYTIHYTRVLVGESSVTSFLESQRRFAPGAVIKTK